MNLIEKLGGYEKAKEFFIDSNGADWIGVFYMTKLNQDLLEHRRENNIFEVGDLVIIDGYNSINPIQDIVDDCWYIAFSDHLLIGEFGHATPEEIKSGHRL